FFASRRRHTRSSRSWCSDVCSSDLHSRVLRRENIGPGDAGHRPYVDSHSRERAGSTAPFDMAHTVPMSYDRAGRGRAEGGFGTARGCGATCSTWERGRGAARRSTGGGSGRAGEIEGGRGGVFRVFFA